MINNTLVEVNKNETGHYRGLHIVMIEPKTGSAEFAQVFDTYKNSTELDKFIERDIPEGHIIVAACQDDCATALSEKAKQWFADMGAIEIWNVGYREGYAFIGKQKSSTSTSPKDSEVTEKRSEVKNGVATATHMF